MTPQKYGTDHITAAFGIRICMVGKTRREEEERRRGKKKKDRNKSLRKVCGFAVVRTYLFPTNNTLISLVPATMGSTPNNPRGSNKLNIIS